MKTKTPRRIRDLLFGPFRRRGRVCRSDTLPSAGPLVVELRSGTWTLDEDRTSWGQEDGGPFLVTAWWTRDPTAPEGHGEICSIWSASRPPTRKDLARGIHQVRTRIVQAPAPLDLAAFEIHPEGARWLMGAFHLMVGPPLFRSWASVPDAYLAAPAHRIAWSALEVRRLAHAAPVKGTDPVRRRR